MNHNIDKMDFYSSSNQISKDRSKTVDRITYEAEVDVIKKQIGDLEDIRFRLGLSARKMAQLLMVDPSAWSRWSNKITPPPPHIYRALQWYLILNEKNPGFTPQVFLANHWHSLKNTKNDELTSLHSQIHDLENKIETLSLTISKDKKLTHSKFTFFNFESNNKMLLKALFLILLGVAIGLKIKN